MSRLVAGDAGGEDAAEGTLRPQTLASFVGQTQVCANLKVFIDAARGRAEALDHVLFVGPPGLGKTTLAQIVSRELGVNFRATSGPVTALEDFELDLIIGEGPAARSVKIDLAPFTLVGATTRLGLLTTPLRDRFGIPVRLNFYETKELESIVRRGARILGIGLTEEGAREVARRSRGTPRIATRLLRRVRDFAAVEGVDPIDAEIADRALRRLEVDTVGLDQLDRRYLDLIARSFGGGPVGVETISAALSEPRDAIEEIVEPFLIQLGFVQRTPRGRLLTPQVFAHLGLDVPSTAGQFGLFGKNVDDDG